MDLDFDGDTVQPSPPSFPFSFLLPRLEHTVSQGLERKEGQVASLALSSRGLDSREARKLSRTSSLFDNTLLSVQVKYPLPIPHRQHSFGSCWDGI